MRKTIRQRLIERLWHDFQLTVDPTTLHSFRRNGYGAEIISWSTIGRSPEIESFLTMRQCVLLPSLHMYRVDSCTCRIDSL
jgi:hypothetical protein